MRIAPVPVTKTFDKFAENVNKHIDAACIQLEGMLEARSQALLKTVLKPDELEKWDAIERKIVRYVQEVKWFSHYTKEKFELIQVRVGNQKYKSLKDCYDGFDPRESADKMKNLRKEGMKIIDEVQDFRTSTEKRLGEEQREESRGILVDATCAVICMVALTFTFFSPVSSNYVKTATNGIESKTALIALGLGPFGIGYVAAQKVIEARGLQKKTDTAIAYLRDIETNLGNLCESLNEVYSSTKTFAALNERDDRVLIQNKITKIIGHLSELIDLCKQVILGGNVNQAQGSWCSIM